MEDDNGDITNGEGPRVGCAKFPNKINLLWHFTAIGFERALSIPGFR